MISCTIVYSTYIGLKNCDKTLCGLYMSKYSPLYSFHVTVAIIPLICWDGESHYRSCSGAELCNLLSQVHTKNKICTCTIILYV